MKDKFNSYIFNKTRKRLCTGCGVCAQLCPKRALVMREDEEGFLYPQINPELCVECGLCDKKCPVMYETHYACKDFGQYCLLATRDEDDQSNKYATIGVCTRISREAFNRGWKVFGVKLDENEWKTYHQCAQSLRDIDLFSNSKYAQSDTRQTYTEAKASLAAGYKVLYIGTPCQIAGLKAFIRDTKNLYTIDLICHGTFSSKLLKREVEHWEKKYGGRISNLYFRSKIKYPWTAGGMVNFNIWDGSKNKHIEVHASGSPTYKCFAYCDNGVNYNLRPSCYTCQFRDSKRYADLTVGDAWRVKDDTLFKEKSKQNGVSLLICNSVKAEELIQLLQGINFKPLEIKRAFVQSALLPSSRDIPAEREQIYKIKDEDEYASKIEQLLNINLEESLNNTMSRLKKEKMKRIIKSFIFFDKWHHKVSQK